MKHRLPLLALTLVAFALPAQAQPGEPTRAEEARRAREEKAAVPPPPTTGKVERFLNWIERGPLFSGTRDGVGIRVGVENGHGLALGPAWRTSGAFGGSMHIFASGVASIAGDRQLSAEVGMPRLAAGRLAVGLDLDATHLAQERFYGVGMNSARTSVAAFALDQRRVSADVALTAARWLRLSASAGTLMASSGDAQGRGVPPISTRDIRDDAAGLGIDHSYSVVSLSAVVDARDVPQNPRRGGRYSIAARRYAALNRRPYSFTRVDAEAEQHVSFWKRQRLITLRAVASTALTADGHEVPFFLQPTLGGSQRLRGFVTDRFRDRSLVAVQAEYGWDLSPFLNAVLFYEAGAVGQALRSIKPGDFRGDYGIGFRFGSARTVAFRTDVAFGSGEGTRLTMRFNHAF